MKRLISTLLLFIAIAMTVQPLMGSEKAPPNKASLITKIQKQPLNYTVNVSSINVTQSTPVVLSNHYEYGAIIVYDTESIIPITKEKKTSYTYLLGKPINVIIDRWKYHLYRCQHKV